MYRSSVQVSGLEKGILGGELEHSFALRQGGRSDDRHLELQHWRSLEGLTL